MAGPWQEALGKLLAAGRAKGETAAHWPVLSNRDASGLILFARSAAAYARDHGLPSATFDEWYQFSLPALGWKGSGDKFALTDAQQTASYERMDELWMAISLLADRLDDAHVPFDLAAVGSPIGSDATYKRLAGDAWATMKAGDDAAAAAAHPKAQAAADNLKAATGRDVAADADAAAKKDKKAKDGGGGGLAILAVLLLLAADDDGRRSRRRSY